MARASNPQSEGRRAIISTSSLTSKKVRNPSGEDLGKIEDIMLDSTDGSVAYAVLSFGGFMGMGDKLFAIPWQEIGMDRDRDHVILNVSEDVLKDAPGFDKDNWPDFGDPQWSQQVHSHYGTTPHTRREMQDRPRA